MVLKAVGGLHHGGVTSTVTGPAAEVDTAPTNGPPVEGAARCVLPAAMAALAGHGTGR
ncbi:MAG: hypothetical protein MOP51_2808 [Citricoccus sp.]|nr:hypothetical protein [Citricoccus sp. WCRC_4]